MGIKVMSKAEAEGYAASEHLLDSVIISISSVNEVRANIKPSNINNIKDVLFLTFNDTDKGEHIITKMDAVKIKNFVKKYMNTPRLIVHCEAGQSRSAGVAAAIMKYMTNDDTSIFNNPRYTPNMKCYRVVLETLID